MKPQEEQKRKDASSRTDKNAIDVLATKQRNIVAIHYGPLLIKILGTLKTYLKKMIWEDIKQLLGTFNPTAPELISSPPQRPGLQIDKQMQQHQTKD